MEMRVVTPMNEARREYKKVSWVLSVVSVIAVVPFLLGVWCYAHGEMLGAAISMGAALIWGTVVGNTLSLFFLCRKTVHELEK